MRIRSALLPAVLAVSVLVPAAARAQAPSLRADALRAGAEALFERPTRYRQAADLLVRSARLRDDSDPEKVPSLLKAARLYDYGGDFGRAASNAIEAGRIALRNGELVSAGHAWIDAALLGGN